MTDSLHSAAHSLRPRRKAPFRSVLVLFHRWVGLLMASFLVIVGMTGSVLAFKTDLEHIINPQLFAKPRPGVPPLDLVALAENAAALVPLGKVSSVSFAGPDQVSVGFHPRKNPTTGQPYDLGFTQLFLDPWTGQELGRRRYGDLSQGRVNLLPFVYQLHYELAMGVPGVWVLGIVALLWTLDCFVGFYLTLPASNGRFWQRWKLAWLIKWRASTYRINFDLHRASGLWLWLALLIFGWSSVQMNLWDTVYTWTTRVVMDYRPVWTELHNLPEPLENPRLDWREALNTSQHLMAEEAASQAFSVEKPITLSFDADRGVYAYTVRSSREIKGKGGSTTVFFDANTGALLLLDLPTGQHSGNTFSNWLYELHTARVFGLTWRIFVCILGLVISVLSVTGIYVWWRKRRVRISMGIRRSAWRDTTTTLPDLAMPIRVRGK